MPGFPAAAHSVAQTFAGANLTNAALADRDVGVVMGCQRQWPPQRQAVHTVAGCVPPHRAPPETRVQCLERAAHCLWAVLITGIYEVLPPLYPLCGGQMRRLERGHKSSRIGIGQRKLQPTTASISASLGEREKRGLRCVAGWVRVRGKFKADL